MSLVTKSLPRPLEASREEYAGARRAFTEPGGRCQGAGPLDARTRRLAKPARAAGAGPEGAARSAVRNAPSEGVTAEVSKQVAILSITTTGFPPADGGRPPAVRRRGARPPGPHAARALRSCRLTRGGRQEGEAANRDGSPPLLRQSALQLTAARSSFSPCLSSRRARARRRGSSCSRLAPAGGRALVVRQPEPALYRAEERGGAVGGGQQHALPLVEGTHGRQAPARRRACPARGRELLDARRRSAP